MKRFIYAVDLTLAGGVVLLFVLWYRRPLPPESMAYVGYSLVGLFPARFLIKAIHKNWVAYTQRKLLRGLTTSQKTLLTFFLIQDNPMISRDCLFQWYSVNHENDAQFLKDRGILKNNQKSKYHYWIQDWAFKMLKGESKRILGIDEEQLNRVRADYANLCEKKSVLHPLVGGGKSFEAST